MSSIIISDGSISANSVPNIHNAKSPISLIPNPQNIIKEIYQHIFITYVTAEKLLTFPEATAATPLNAMLKTITVASKFFRDIIYDYHEKLGDKDSQGKILVTFINSELEADFTASQHLTDYRSGIIFLCLNILKSNQVYRGAESIVSANRNIKDLSEQLNKALHFSQCFLQTTPSEDEQYIKKCNSQFSIISAVKNKLISYLTSVSEQPSISFSVSKLNSLIVNVCKTGVQLIENERKIIKAVIHESNALEESSMIPRCMRLNEAFTPLKLLLKEVESLHRHYLQSIKTQNLKKEFEMFKQTILDNLKESPHTEASIEKLKGEFSRLKDFDVLLQTLIVEQKTHDANFNPRCSFSSEIQVALELDENTLKELQKTLVLFKIIFKNFNDYSEARLSLSSLKKCCEKQMDLFLLSFFKQEKKALEILSESEVIETSSNEEIAFHHAWVKSFQKNLDIMCDGKDGFAVQVAELMKIHHQKFVERTTHEIKKSLQVLDIFLIDFNLSYLDEEMFIHENELEGVCENYLALLTNHSPLISLWSLSQKRIQLIKKIKDLTAQLKTQKPLLVGLRQLFKEMNKTQSNEALRTFDLTLERLNKKMLDLQAQLSHLYSCVSVIKGLATALAFKRYPVPQLKKEFLSLSKEYQEYVSTIRFDPNSQETTKQTLATLDHFSSEFKSQREETQERFNTAISTIRKSIEAAKTAIAYDDNEVHESALCNLVISWNALQILNAYCDEQTTLFRDIFEFIQMTCHSLAGEKTTLGLQLEFEETPQVSFASKVLLMERPLASFEELSQRLTLKQKSFKNKMSNKLNLMKLPQAIEGTEWHKEAAFFNKFFESLHLQRKELKILFDSFCVTHLHKEKKSGTFA